MGGKNGWRIYTRQHIGKIKKNIEKSTQGCEKWFLRWGKPHAGGYVLAWLEMRCSTKVTEFGYFL